MWENKEWAGNRTSVRPEGSYCDHPSRQEMMTAGTGRTGVVAVETERLFRSQLEDSRKPCQLPPPASNTPVGHPAVFFKSIRKGSKSLGGGKYLSNRFQ